jgi:hypothetical protein
VTFRGPLMISLCALAGLGEPGCSGPVGFPPPTAIPGTPMRSLPSAARAQAFQSPAFNPSNRANPAIANFPWEPGAASRQWTSIVIHHTASSHGSVESIHEAHLKRKDKDGNSWQGIGYHFVIGNGNGMSDGEIEPTFRWREQLQGAHAGSAEYNERGIGIALVGNFDEGPPTAAQLAAIKQLVTALKFRYQIPSNQVIGHSEIKATACPGKFFPLDEVRISFAGASFGQRGNGAARATLVGDERSVQP